MKLRFHIRNHWGGWHSDKFYWFGAGYAFQGPQLLVWHFWLAGFCFCLFIDRENTDKYPRPFPHALNRWWRKRKYSKQ